MIYRNYIKRLFDFLSSILLFIILLPVFLLLIVICTIAFNGRPFFKQQRAGYKERIFMMLKFKTMKDVVDHLHQPLPDHERLNSIGKFLRRTSLDELPQLINVIKGEMSIVGPRPLLERYLPWYTESENKRHDIKPGITGYAQVNGRNILSWDERLALDVYYTENISLKIDIAIIFKTIRQLLFPGKIVAADPRSTLNDFDDERSRKKSIRISDQIILRKPVPNDATQLLEVKNNREGAAMLEHENSGYTLKDIQNWIWFHLNNPQNLVYAIVDHENKKIIGHVGFYDIQNHGCDFGILIGLPSYWHKGIGLIVTKKMLHIGFKELYLNKIFLSVLQKNVRAVELYKQIGFKLIEEKAIQRNNETETIYRMLITENDLPTY